MKIQNGEALEPDERIRYEGYFRAMNRNQDNVLSQYDAGMLGENTPRSVADFACSFVGMSEASIEIWELTKRGYTDRYTAFIEKAMADCD